ncbi:GNAT family N-acetyltransferase [Mucilaginibacter sabulilitoris]|uniref:GNAT family N-acetyltransferase n=1 Tax=Mucilaginibacter sabulilitoris TaxID=1173583 RepID=A0ABZ0TSZ6_9SPHI|nr:GNAT family N-acetyltransferase [Mucilaginibacter sabulilitoris]WPU96054.1 GNAT family N-acetyltransferase [Mucilaginibacter sabulilitoris]
MIHIQIKPLQNIPQIRAELSGMLIEVVANGGSVGFMHPLSLSDANAFWDSALAAAFRSERIILGAFDGDKLVGTVTLLLNLPPNQPHRAEIAKMMTRVSHRGRGIAKALLQTAESLAIEQGKNLLVLDTAQEEGASGLYEKLGFTLTGIIPDYALKPHGGLTATMIYWKRIG